MEHFKGACKGLIRNYKTEPTVTIEDPFLAVTALILKATVIFYFVSSAIIEQRYLEKVPITGSTWLTLTSSNETVPQPVRKCSGKACPTWVEWDAAEVMVTSGSSMFVKTRMKEQHAVSSCKKVGCRTGFEVQREESFFIEGVEDLLLEFKAHVSAAELEARHCKRYWKKCPFGGDLKDYDGKLVDSEGNVIAEINKGNARFPLRTWLKSAGVHDLNDDHYQIDRIRKPLTFRSAGFALQLHCKWSNLADNAADWGHLDSLRTLWKYLLTKPPLRYELEVRMIPYSTGSMFDVHSHTQDANGKQERLTREYSGIDMKAVNSGYASRFSFINIVTYVGSNVGILAVVSFLLNLFWQHILPRLGRDYDPFINTKVEELEDGSLKYMPPRGTFKQAGSGHPLWKKVIVASNAIRQLNLAVRDMNAQE